VGQRRRLVLWGVLAVWIVAAVGVGVLTLMGAFAPTYSMKVETIRGSRLCGERISGHQIRRGTVVCITPDASFSSTKTLLPKLRPGDCVTYSTGEGGPRLEHRTSCPG